jgi:CBS domain-containing protein
MNVGDLCICDVAAVGPQTSVTKAGTLMRRYNVGSLPVIDRNERPIGMITDRDIALALTQRNAHASEVLVDEVMTEGAAICDVDDDVRDVLRIMAREQVRRLPVVDERGQLEGIISIDDIICHAVDVDGGRELPYDLVVETLCKIAQPYRAETGPAREPASRSRGG